MNEDTIYVSVTVVSQESGPIISREQAVNLEYVKIMMKADYVTIDGMTIKKDAVEIDHQGSVTFYGEEVHRKGDFLNI